MAKKSKEKSDQPSVGKTTLKLKIDGKKRSFNIDDAKLPDWIDDGALASGDFPYTDKMNRDEYEKTLEQLQIELVKMQSWLQETGGRVISVFEGRDAAGKGGTIFTLRQYMNPRNARNVALPKPTETESGQWYFQRYVSHFPTKGEFVTFDRSRAVGFPALHRLSASRRRDDRFIPALSAHAAVYALGQLLLAIRQRCLCPASGYSLHRPHQHCDGISVVPQAGAARAGGRNDARQNPAVDTALLAAHVPGGMARFGTIEHAAFPMGKDAAPASAIYSRNPGPEPMIRASSLPITPTSRSL